MEEAAEYLGVIVKTVYRLINTDQIPAYKIGRVIRVKREDVDRWLESRRVHPGELDHLVGPPNTRPGSSQHVELD